MTPAELDVRAEAIAAVTGENMGTPDTPGGGIAETGLEDGTRAQDETGPQHEPQPPAETFGNYLSIALNYAHQVVAGEVPACKWTKAACRRQLDDLARAESDPHYPFVWVPAKAEHICRFIELLPHIKGEWAGQRIHLEAWQVFILATVFGWYRRDNRRRFRVTYIEVPRKNAKSTLSSGVALYMLTADGEAGAEVYSAATTREQAKIVFNDAREMTLREPGFRHRFGVRVHMHNLASLSTSSKFEPLSAEGSTLDGLNVHFAVVDELHAHKTRAVYDVIETGMGARAQPMQWNITTAGSDRAGICYEQRTYVTSLLNTVLRAHDGLGYPVKGACAEDDTYFGIIYSIDDEDDWADEKCWAKANPNYGVSVYPDDIKRLANKAIKVASARGNFLTKRLNVWVNAATAWMDMRAWDKCADPALEESQFTDARCWIALDLASKIDIADKVKLFERDGHYTVFCVHYLPAQAAEEESNSQYAGWAEEGWLTTTPGNVTDYDLIERGIRDDLATYNVIEVPYDPWQAQQLANHLTDEGAPMVELRQTVQNMSEAMKQFEALVLAGRFHHNGDPVLSWMVSNVVAWRDAKDNIYPRKEREQNKIDGVVAIIMALARAIVAREQYSSPEVMVV